MKAINTGSDSSLLSDTTEGNALTPDSTDTDYATYYLLIADTGTDYYALDRKMYDLSHNLKKPIDTMDRSFNKQNNLIALPDDAEDEIYAGDYYPRREPSDYLSLEYLNFYQGEAHHQTMALVAGIYETEKGADSALFVMKQAEPKSFIMKAEVFVGCMH